MNSVKVKMQRLSEKTCRIIEDGGSIYVKGSNGSYVGQYTNFARTDDQIQWTTLKHAMEFETLSRARAFASTVYLNCTARVVIVYPKKKKNDARPPPAPPTLGPRRIVD